MGHFAAMDVCIKSCQGEGMRLINSKQDVPGCVFVWGAGVGEDDSS